MFRERVTSIAQELARTRTVRDPGRGHLMNSRKALIAGWTKIAEILDAQGEINLAGYVRYFARHLPPVLTDKERSTVELIRYQQGSSGAAPSAADPRTRDRADDFTR
jgi:hypothetical protein